MCEPTGEPRKDDQDRQFVALYDEYGSLLFRVGHALLGSGADAEDAVQSVFLSLIRRRKSLSGIADMRAYMLSALRHAAARTASRRTKERRLMQQAARSELESAPVAKYDEAFELEKALRSLPPDQREIIALKIDGGLTFGEIATLLLFWNFVVGLAAVFFLGANLTMSSAPSVNVNLTDDPEGVATAARRLHTLLPEITAEAAYAEVLSASAWSRLPMVPNMGAAPSIVRP